MDKNADTPPKVVALKELCQQKLVKNYSRIRCLGATPQFLVAKALSQCTAEQLETIEELNPHIMDDNEGLWWQLYAKKYGDPSTTGEAVPSDMISWRERYREMRLDDEVRAHEMRERVRNKVKEAERERDARKIRIADIKKVGGIVKTRTKTSTSTKGMSLVQKARLETRAHMQRMSSTPRQSVSVNRASQQNHSGSVSQLAKAKSHGATQLPSPRVPAPPVTLSSPKHDQQQQQQQQQQLSPAGSPSYSSPSYSPPYLSSSCSPTHSSSAYSPPYVPDPYPPSIIAGGYSPKYDIFETIFGVSASRASASVTSTAPIKDGTRPRRAATSRKYGRGETGDSDHQSLRFSPDRQDASEF